jgi:SAM-dependent methyltransferase
VRLTESFDSAESPEADAPIRVQRMRVISVAPEAPPKAQLSAPDSPPPIIEASEVAEDDIEDALSLNPPPAELSPEPVSVEPEPATSAEKPSEKSPEDVEALDEAELTDAPAPPPPPRRKMPSTVPGASVVAAPPASAQPAAAQPPVAGPAPVAAPPPVAAQPPAAAAAAPAPGSNFPAPPKRPPRTESPHSELSASPSEEAPRSQGPVTRRRPWWELMFGEDFARAEKPLSLSQVKHEVDFMIEALGLAPGAVILDLCCGQGQHAVELASRGYGVVGYDLSVYQLAIAGDNAQARHQKINFLQGDMREMAFDEMFDAVVCWDSSFGYFEEEKNHNVAERIFRALRPGGLFLLDVINRDAAAVGSPNHVWFEGDGAVCMDDMSVDWITSRLRVKRSLILDDGRSRECSYSLRLYNLHELGKLLHDVGFRVTQASGQIATPGVFFGPCSPRIIMRAQKPE